MSLDRIYVVGYYGYGNTGDEAMRLGLQQILNHKGYDNVRFYNKGQGFWDLLWADKVILGGGTHLRNWGANWVEQSLRIYGLGMLSTILGKGFYMVNVDIDGENLTKWAQEVSDNVTLRDKDTFDSSIVLDFNPRPKKNLLGINLTPVYKVYYDDYARDRRLAINLMNKVKVWLKNNPGYVVKFFNFNRADEELNMLASQELQDTEFVPWQPNPIETLEEISECSHFIGMRYHSNQFAYKSECSMVVINAYPSCKKFARFVGVNSIDKESILDNYFKLDFKKADLPINTAKALAFKGVVI